MRAPNGCVRDVAGVPHCPVCTDILGREGGPCSLPCGHNGCVYCLKDVQARKSECPLCRAPFPTDYPLFPNPELRELVTMAKFNSGCVEEEGWEAVPTRARAINMYAQELGGALQRAPDATATDPGDMAIVEERTAQAAVRGAAGGLLPGGAAPMAIVAGSYHAPQTGRYPFESILAWVPPQWMPDSCAAACKGCGMQFRPVVRLRHHCRLCGLIFCHQCSSQKLLLPPKFGQQEPQRVCNRCFDVLKPAELQNALAGHFSKAAQQPVHDVTDWTSMRAWLNNPLTSTLEADIFKCTNILRHFVYSSRLSAERAIPASMLQEAAGFAVLSVLKVGMGWSCSIGSGLLVARCQDGSWSPPSALGLGGLGWGLQAGGELTDLLLVLTTPEAVKAFCGEVHLGVGGNLNVSVGPLGREATASVHLGRRGYAMAYSYSCSRGAFVGMSVDGSVMHTRANANLAFYGRPLTAKDLLLGGCVDAPPAARTLYEALESFVNSFGYHALQQAAARQQPLPLRRTVVAEGEEAEMVVPDEKRPASTATAAAAVEARRDSAPGALLMPQPSAPQAPPALSASPPRGRGRERGRGADVTPQRSPSTAMSDSHSSDSAEFMPNLFD